MNKVHKIIGGDIPKRGGINILYYNVFFRFEL